jgi:response regulator RpfG family c-di-GMP phosphodiesterase
VNLLILVVDDEPDVEVLFRQHFRHDLRAGRFTMEFAQSAPTALQRITDAAGVSLILILSDINMPGMSGLELLPKTKALRRSRHHDHRLRRCGDQASGIGEWCRDASDQADRLCDTSQRDRRAGRGCHVMLTFT